MEEPLRSILIADVFECPQCGCMDLYEVSKDVTITTRMEKVVLLGENHVEVDYDPDNPDQIEYQDADADNRDYVCACGYTIPDVHNWDQLFEYLTELSPPGADKDACSELRPTTPTTAQPSGDPGGVPQEGESG